MKRKIIDENEDEIVLKNKFLQLGKLYDYKITATAKEYVFGPPVDVKIKNIDHTYQILIYNLTKNFKIENIFSLLFKKDSLHKLKYIKANNDFYAFASYTNEQDVKYICDLLNNFENIRGDTIQAITCRNINKIYITNIKIRKINFYKFQWKLLRLLIGIREITFYSVDKYRRYSALIEFFKSCDTELGLKLLFNDNLFQSHPEIVVDVKHNSAFRSEPAVLHRWDNQNDSQNMRPHIIVLNRMEARHLQMF